MANAQIMQEELQQSVLLSEEDADFERDADFEEDDDADNTMHIDNPIPANPDNSSANPDTAQNPGGQADVPNPPLHSTGDGEIHAEAEQDEQGGLDEDMVENVEEGEGDEEQGDEEADSEISDVHDDDGAFEDEDAEGEEDEEVIDAPGEDQNAVASGAEDEEEDEDEGVGAVKVKPGETDESESESEDDASLASGGSSDGESAAEWEEAADNEEDDDEDDDSEAATNNCIFCKKPEEEDPAEEFEQYLACKGCGEHGMFRLYYPVCPVHTYKNVTTDAVQHINYARGMPMHLTTKPVSLTSWVHHHR